MGKKHKNIVDRPPWFDENANVRHKLVGFFIHLLAWIGLAVIFYLGFSIFFDTPIEYRMKISNEKLEREYNALNARYDTIAQVLDNVVNRDRALFSSLFEAEPYSFDDGNNNRRWRSHEQLYSRDNKTLANELTSKSSSFADNISQMETTLGTILDKIAVSRRALDDIPSIQPVLNNDLTLLTASFGMRINPFYKLLTQHNGVDFSVPTGTRVFATAGGVVLDVSTRGASTGLTLILRHGNGYMTTYANLDKIMVQKNQSVKRGDIVALSGNTGQSLAPHLHYEISKNGMRVDPIHYFFMELSPSGYQKIMRIAESGMQSFD